MQPRGSRVRIPKRVKSSSSVDQLDEVEVEPLSTTELDWARACHMVVRSQGTEADEGEVIHLSTRRDVLQDDKNIWPGEFFTLGGSVVEGVSGCAVHASSSSPSRTAGEDGSYSGGGDRGVLREHRKAQRGLARGLAP